jgi:pyruvate-formate lyase-activating enzyme
VSRAEVDGLIEELGLPGAARQHRVAAILFTYRCTIACRHCLFGCAGTRPDVVMTPRQCADGLAMLHETGRVVHIAGGEPMLYWGNLAESVRLAHEEGNAPHFIETNCSFAVTDEIVRERFAFLKSHGLKGMYASADAYHQEWVPPERFLRVRRLTSEIFGDDRFYGPERSEEDTLALADVTRDEARLRDYVRNHAPNMVGTAHKRLSGFVDGYDPRDPALPKRGWQGVRDSDSCLREFLEENLWEIHIDPYGNLQTNCCMILGHISETTPAKLFARGPERANRFVRTVCESGPMGLAELAIREYGFEMPERVTQNCELCHLARSFLRRFHPEVFGPAEVYGQA